MMTQPPEPAIKRAMTTTSVPHPAAKLIVGCGYLGERVARRWLAAGHDVWVTTRSALRAAQFERAGLRPIVVDITRPFQFPPSTPNFHTVLSAVGFDRTSGLSIHDVYVAGLRHVLDALPAIDRFLYISSTGVFGQSHGEWVDEQSPCHPVRSGGQACFAAEQLLAEHPHGTRRIVLRLAGIYGPQRIPKLEAVRWGEPIESPEHGFLNLIHVDDAAEIILAAETQLPPPELLVVSDGHPVLRADFYRELARLLQAPEPRFLPPRPGSSTAERGISDKRVCSDHLRRQLPHLTYRFPSYREGLAAIVEQSGAT